MVLQHVQSNLHEEVDAYYDQEWCTYEYKAPFEGEGDDDDDDGGYDYAPAA
ncbi:hypothetical protein Lalb_Chr13g0302171 [Lupinus albus]|uniref:Uncharacterized protein n=1 Tax=Lupinus albus TaxID=3870 RepID=A0A6A4PJY0_LUPAL|nr:hypothetical protein Lalb_Chr13g0302171 [Lupinus albus]